MSDEIPFNKILDLTPGVVDEVAPGVRRVLADNPGPFTLRGTLSYIVGRGRVAIIDPEPADAGHIAALLDAVRGETVTHILITHTHRDHSPGAAPVKAATGAITLGEGPHRAARPLFLGETVRTESGGDLAFVPDRRLADGDVIVGDGWALEAIATPGHTANHMAFALKGTGTLFSGDHVMGWSTTIVGPARWRDERLQGLAASLGDAPRDHLPRRPR
jgi:glyoxylase-like metal-dependent hydrolase (beta-lactamase superfamily II)